MSTRFPDLRTVMWKHRLLGLALGISIAALIVKSGVGYSSLFLGPLLGLIFLIVGWHSPRPWLTWAGITLFGLAFLVIGVWLVWLWMNSLAHPGPA